MSSKFRYQMTLFQSVIPEFENDYILVDVLWAAYSLGPDRF